MRIAYISCFSAPEPSLSEYSSSFEKYLHELTESVGGELCSLDLSAWEGRRGRVLAEEVATYFRSFIEQKGPFDYYHFEFVEHHLMVWQALLTKQNLDLKGQVVVTLHDPPLAVHKSLCLKLPDNGFAGKVARAVDLWFPSILFNKAFTQINHFLFLTREGQEAFSQKWKVANEQLHCLPHLPFPRQKKDHAETVSKTSTIKVFFAGIWWKHKGIEELLMAVELVSSRGNEVELAMSGTGPASYVEKILILLDKLKGKGIPVKLLGHLPIEEMYETGSQADCWVLPYQKTRKVCHSGILMRALTAGAQIVISDLPQFEGLRERYKLHVYERGSPSDLARQIVEAASHTRPQLAEIIKSDEEEIRACLRTIYSKEISVQ